MYIYIYTYLNICSFGSVALQSSVVDLWDTVFFMSMKAYVALMSKLESFLSEDYLRTISNLSIPYTPHPPVSYARPTITIIGKLTGIVS